MLALQAAQKESRDNSAIAALGLAGSHLGAALSRGTVKPDSNYFDALQKSAGDPVKDLAAREGVQKGEDADKSVQAIVQAFPTFAKALPPEMLKNLKAEQLPVLSQMLTAQSAQTDKRDALKAAALARTDTLDQRKDEFGQRQQAHQDMLDARKDEFGQRMADRNTQRASSAEEHRLTREAAADNLQASREQRSTTEKEKRDRVISERNVGGYAFDPANPPSADASKKMGTISIAKDQILGSLGQLEDTFHESGTEMGFGHNKSVMESAWIDITNQLRTLNKMGVPNGADYLMLAKQLEDPTTFSAMMRPNADFQTKFKELRRQIAQTVDATAKAYKFHPAPEGGGPVGGGKVTVRKGDEERDVDPENLPAAAAKGWLPVGH